MQTDVNSGVERVGRARGEAVGPPDFAVQSVRGGPSLRLAHPTSLEDLAYIPKVRKSWAERRRATIGLTLLTPFLAAALVSPSWVAAGSWGEVALGSLGWTLFFAGGAMRLWATLHVGGRKGQEVVAEGPYSMTRNPLYFGTFLITLSIGCFLHSLTLTCGVVIATMVYLRVTLPSEERRLASKLGPEYREYCRLVPRFWPSPALLRMPEMIRVDMHCLGMELIRGLRWMWLPVAASALARLRLEAGWPQWLGLP